MVMMSASFISHKQMSFFMSVTFSWLVRYEVFIFAGGQFGRTRLKPGIVPSVFPWSIEQAIEPNKDSQDIDSDNVNITDLRMEVPLAFTAQKKDVYEEVIAEVIAPDVVLDSSDESSSANAAEINISNNKISVASSGESSTTKTTESNISDDKISESSCEVQQKEVYSMEDPQETGQWWNGVNVNLNLNLVI
ncbi:hypothetical protein QAD02_019729 [Eretmocerus hayati]|uniref:Uncharacterized protein n=1 Tax=Eretmocerus hayati TaxID=131215 RepID=A0ACC2PNM8_9HYME|nr:hypothetical protein QAD02_019729 [Eretmocerus hayati]